MYIRCRDCKFNTPAKNLGEEVRLCVIPLPVGVERVSCRIHDERKQGCVFGEYPRIRNSINEV